MTGIGIAVRDRELSIAAELGFDYAELSARAVCSMSEADFSRLARETPLPILGMNAYCPPEIVITGPKYSAARARAYAKACAKRADALGAKLIGIGSPNSRKLPEGFPPALMKRQIAEFLTITADEFGKYDIAVCFEALAPCYCNAVNRIAEAAEAVRSLALENVKLVADFYNMELASEADTPLAAYADILAHAHISDDDGLPTLRSFLKPEKESAHAARLRGLVSAGYEGGVTLEIDVPIDRNRAAESLSLLRRAAKG